MRPRSNFSAAARATARWPRCTGSKVPPKRAILMRLSALPLPESRLLGDSFHAFRFLLGFAAGDGFLSGGPMLLRQRICTNLFDPLAESVLQFRNTLAGHGGDLIEVELQLLGMFAQLGDYFWIGHVHL